MRSSHDPTSVSAVLSADRDWKESASDDRRSKTAPAAFHENYGARVDARVLQPHLIAWLRDLNEQRYAVSSLNSRARDISAFGRWLHKREKKIGDVNERTIQEYLASFPKNYGYARIAARVLQFVDRLRELEVIPKAPLPKPSSVEDLIARYSAYLIDDLARSPETARVYARFVRTFLREIFARQSVRPSRITARIITNYIRKHAGDHGRAYAKLMVTALRSLLGYLFLKAEIDRDLRSTVPPVANWRRADLPKYVSESDIVKVVRFAKPRNAMQRRDYAILLLLVQLGLRAGEVAFLNLDDIDFPAGKITVTGKGSRGELPLPAEAGAAIAEYLQRDRPKCTCRRLFLCVNPPFRGFVASSSVSVIARLALVRAGVKLPRKGAHAMRHSLATHMLGRGANLEQVSVALRHKDQDSTTIYAKVNHPTLQKVAAPWLDRVA